MRKRRLLRRSLMATTWRSPLRAGSQPRLKTYFAICERHEERMIWENSHGHRMAQSVVPVGQTRTKSNVRVTSVWLPNVLQNSPSLATATIVRHNNIAGVTSALGHKRTWKLVRVMSALPPKSRHRSQRLACPLCTTSGHQLVALT